MQVPRFMGTGEGHGVQPADLAVASQRSLCLTLVLKGSKLPRP